MNYVKNVIITKTTETASWIATKVKQSVRLPDSRFPIRSRFLLKMKRYLRLVATGNQNFSSEIDFVRENPFSQKKLQAKIYFRRKYSLTKTISFFWFLTKEISDEKFRNRLQ